MKQVVREVASRTPPPDKGEQGAVVAGIEITHPERVLYPEQGITKRELATYYAEIADRILPHVRGRPLALVRCPRGRAETCFYQKHFPKGFPAAVQAIAVEEADGTAAEYVGVRNTAGLVALVQHGVLELHPWGARADKLDRPDRIVIDLDPGPEVEWSRVVDAARELRALFDELGLEAFARTTGGKGLHVVVPIARRPGWDEVKQFSLDVVTALARRDEEGYVLSSSKARRHGRIFLDYLRNARGATAIASYSTRARPGATVATPLAWAEVKPSLEPSDFTTKTLPRRLAARRRDPWAGFFELRQALTSAIRDSAREL